jgi:hypothetical protein
MQGINPLTEAYTELVMALLTSQELEVNTSNV